MTTTGPGVGWPERIGRAAVLREGGGSAGGVGWPGAMATAPEGSVVGGGRTVVEGAAQRGPGALGGGGAGIALDGEVALGGRGHRMDDRAGRERRSVGALRERRGPVRGIDGGRAAEVRVAGREEGANVMQGSGDVRSGLGWPRLSPRDVAAHLGGHGGPGRLPGAMLVAAPAPSSLLGYEGGIGWPAETAVGQSRAADLVAGTAQTAGPTASARLVSRETVAVGRPAAASPAAGPLAVAPPASAPAAFAPRSAVPASLGWPESRGARGPGRPPEKRSAPIPGPVGEGQVWPSRVQGSIPAGRTSEHSVGPMIAGTYSGAVSALGESEDEVAIPAPDKSADTPIERAAQAAMNARAGGQAWPRPKSCRILTIANQKGGVGKTTTAVNLAASLAMNGSRVLVVDLDPQGNASTALDVEHRSGTASIYNVLVDGMPLSEVVRPVEGFQQLFCAPATIDLAGSEIELVPLVARESRLVRAVAQYDASGLDYIFIDCPPSLGLLTVNALVAAPEVMIPIQCEYYALEGLEQLLRTVDLVKSHLNPKLKITTILLTMYDSRTRLASQVADEVRGHFGDLVLGSVIPRSVRVSEAPSYGQSVMTYDPGSSGALAYLEAAREMAFRNTRAATA